MANRTSWLQVRITEQEKDALKRLAEESGETISGYVLSRVLPAMAGAPDAPGEGIRALVPALSDPESDRRATIQELEHDLAALEPHALRDAVPRPADDMPPTLLNFLCAMIEAAAHEKAVEPPAWVHDVPPLPRPHFMWSLSSLIPHQLRVSPVPFKRRNIFIDATDGLRL